MFKTPPPSDPETFRLWREASDLSSRTRMGGSFYLIAWLLIWLWLPKPMTTAAYGLPVSVFFTAMLGARWLHRLPTEADTVPLSRWITWHWALVILTTAVWGMLNALVLYDPQYADIKLVSIVATVAFGMAFSYTFAIRLLPCCIVILLVNVPGLVVLALAGDAQRHLMIGLSIYTIYLLLSSRRSHADYQTIIQLELRLLEQRNSLELLSRTDSLTQLGNRYQFNDLFPALVASAQRQGSPLSLVLLDVDLFKSVNDQYGHAVGDVCLQHFAELMGQLFRRDSDVLLRLGGEEFGVLMPGTTLDKAFQLAEQFRIALNSTNMLVQQHSVHMTTSAGVGCFDPRLDYNNDEFFSRVDSALYKAKAGGRNQVVMAKTEPPPPLPGTQSSTSRHPARRAQ